MSDDQSEDDLDLNSLNDEDLTAQMHDDLYDGMEDEIAEGTNILLGRGWSADRVLNDALVGGMNIVGIDFRDGILFVPEVLMAANAMKAGMAILRPLLDDQAREQKKSIRQCIHFLLQNKPVYQFPCYNAYHIHSNHHDH